MTIPAHMPALSATLAEFGEERPLRGRWVLLHMHLTEETVALGYCLGQGGAAVGYLPSNREPSPERLRARAVELGGRVFETVEELDQVASELDLPAVVIEGNGRFFSLVHDNASDSAFADRIVAISEHTSGGGRKVDRHASSEFRVPVVAVYRDPLKAELETGLGTSQSTVAALLRGGGTPLAGRQVLVVGYGKVGVGLARSLAALGGRVMVSDISAERCLMAQLAGYRVVTKERGLSQAELCVTTTGVTSVLDAHLLSLCKDGVRLANVSNMPNEIDLRECEAVGEPDGARSWWRTPSGVQVEVLGGGIQVNHVVGSGNPSSLMDLSFSLHALAVRWLTAESRLPGLTPVPQSLREVVSTRALGRSCR